MADHQNSKHAVACASKNKSISEDCPYCRIRKLFRRRFISKKQPLLMAKLNQRKVKWLIDQIIQKNKRPKDVCGVYKITERRVQQLVKEFKKTKQYPKLKKNRRPKTYLSEEQKQQIDKAYEETWLTPCMLYYELKRKNQYAPKNKIYEYMKSKCWVQDEPNKQKRKKRCRYEWTYTGDLIHADYHRTSEDQPHCIVWIDDASRKMLAGGEFKEATDKNAIKAFEEAERYLHELGCNILRVNTDKGTQFFNSKFNSKGERPFGGFEKYLEKRGIKHIPSRIKNPRTNGKLERRWYEYDKHRWKFNSLQEWIDWYDNRLTTSLDIDKFETPVTAVVQKIPKTFALFWENAMKERYYGKTKKY